MNLENGSILYIVQSTYCACDPRNHGAFPTFSAAAEFADQVKELEPDPHNDYEVEILEVQLYSDCAGAKLVFDQENQAELDEINASLKERGMEPITLAELLSEIGD